MMDYRKAYWVKNVLTLLSVIFLLLTLLIESRIFWLFFALACVSGVAMLMVTVKFWKCPQCGKNLGGSKPTYCPHCSERLEWME